MLGQHSSGQTQNSRGDALQVSIITPVLNGKLYLEECIQSVLGQSWPFVEHLFVDGGSSDGTLDTLREYSTKYPDRIRLVLAPGTDPGQAWNVGLKAAQGEIFGCIGADDVCEMGAIEAAADFFRSNPDASFVHGHCDIMNEHGEIIRRNEARKFHFKDFVNTALHISTPSAFYRREVMERIGWLDSSGDDFDVMIRIAREYPICRMDRVLAKLRLRPNSAFNPRDFEKRKLVYRDTYKVSRRYGGSMLSPLARRYYVALIIGFLHLQPCFPAIRILYRRVRGISWAW